MKPNAPPAAAEIAAIVQAMRRITKAVHEYSKAVDRRYGITGPQLWALRVLQEGECSAGALAERLCVHPSTITGVIQRLEEKGFVSRTRRVDDRRAVQLSLTEKGRELLQSAPQPAQGQLVHALRALPPGELATFRQTLDRVVAEMDLGGMSARFFFSDD